MNQRKQRLSSQIDAPESYSYFSSGDDRFELLLPDEAFGFAARQCLRAGQHETGGIIIGYYDANLKQAVVTQLTGAPPDSRAQTTWFYRGTRGLLRHLKQMWKKHQYYYLGEWHFHPRGPMLPSSTDKAQMTAIIADASYRCPEPLLLIFGSAPSALLSIGVRAFVFPREEAWQELASKEPPSAPVSQES